MAQKEFETAFSHFRVIKQKGQGGSGIVYKVADQNTSNAGAMYAVKCLNPSETTTIKRKRFQNEIFFCMNNSHKNIVRILDYGLTTISGKPCPFYVMPYYPSTLRELMDQGIANENVIGYFLQILDGIEFAHLMQVWHRDLKPENILYNPEIDALVIADFGIAHFQEEHLQTIVQTDPKARMGNFQYSAPEQRAKGKPVNHKADIYSLGLILNEMFTGEIPQGHSFATIASKSTDFAFLDEIVETMIQQSYDKRFDSIDTIKQRLRYLWDASVSRQRLSRLSNTVIQESEIDDLLVRNPIEIKEFDYKDGDLIFTLSSKINSDWENVFRNPGNFQYMAGIVEPGLIRFSENKAVLKVPTFMEPRQDMINYVKGYVGQANVNYKRLREEQQKVHLENERKKLSEQIKEEQKRQQVRQNLKL